MARAIAAPAAKTEQDYQAESDFHSLQRAEEIRGDKGRHGRAMSHGRKQMSAMQRVMKTAPPAGSTATDTEAPAAPAIRGAKRGKVGRAAKRPARR